MKKRILSLILALCMVLPLLPQLPAKAGNAVNPIDPSCNKGTATPANNQYFPTAYVQNRNGQAQQLQVVVEAKPFEGSQQVSAVVMPAADYDSTFKGNLSTLVNQNTYFNLSGVSDSTRYRMAKLAMDGKTDENPVTMNLVQAGGTAGTNNNNTLTAPGVGATIACTNFVKAPVGSGSNGSYYDKYALIMFQTNHYGQEDRYYVDYFYVDAQGMVCYPSYMVRYNDNNPSQGSGTVTNNISYSSVSENKAVIMAAEAVHTIPRHRSGTDNYFVPSRQGYTFVGWTTKQVGFLDENVDVSDTSEGSAFSKILSDADAKLYFPGNTFMDPAPGAEDSTDELYKIYDLYALWKIRPVHFNTKDLPTATMNQALVTGSDNLTIPVLTMGATKVPQVNVPFSSGWIQLDSRSEPNSTKTYENRFTRTVTAFQYNDKTINGSAAALASKYATLALTKSGAMQWGIVGTPGNNSGGDPVFTIVEVTDSSNNTKDYLMVHFPYIEKGAQPIPTLDANTGLQSRVETTTSEEEPGAAVTVDDGQIYGFYSAGPTIDSADSPTGYLAASTNAANGTYGTGTMTGYYKSKAMIYEYRPLKLKNADGKLEEVAYGADSENAYLPNDGWRELPFPSSWYGSNYSTVEAALTQSNMLGAKTITYSTKPLDANDNATLGTAPTTTDKFKETGWPESYGSIRFDDGLPVIHGLVEGNWYEIRFRSNTNYAVSEAQAIEIGGVAGGSSTPSTQSGGLAINLAGGKVVDDPTTTDVDEKDIYDKFVTAGKAMQDGETLDIPNITPVRENYAFGGWTLGEYDKDGELIIYKYAAPATGTEPSTGGDNKENTDETGSGGGSSGTGNPGTGDGDGEGDDGDTTGGNESENPVTPEPVTYPSKVTLNDSPQALAAVWNATNEGFASITFYDWDETTVLGSVVVAKGQDATSTVQEFAKSLQSPASRDVTGAESDPFFVDDSKYPLTYKKGYSFEGCWLPFESDTPTVYGTRVDAGNAGTLVTPTPMRPTTEEMTFTDVTKNLIVKAAYNENTELDISTAGNRRYTTQAIRFTRYGVTTNYGITVEVRRKNTNDSGIPRIVSPALRVTLSTSAGNILMLLPLDSSDIATAEIVANGAVNSVSWVVIETYNNNNWAGAGVRSATGTSRAGTMNVRDSGFLYTCALGGINDMLEEYTTMEPKSSTVFNYINNNSLTGIGLTLPAGLSATDAKNRLLSAWEEKNCVRNEDGTPMTDESGKKVIQPKDTRVGLEFDEMNVALANGT